MQVGNICELPFMSSHSHLKNNNNLPLSTTSTREQR